MVSVAIRNRVVDIVRGDRMGYDSRSKSGQYANGSDTEFMKER